MNNKKLSPEEIYSQQSAVVHRKQFAQFFTPEHIAACMSQWVMGKRRKTLDILDPAIGLGIFERYILQKKPNTNIIGYDIDPVILQQCSPLLPKATLHCDDYLFSSWSEIYDGIVCNPPYLKFNEYQNKDKAIAQLHQETGLKINGFSNIYTLFMLKSLHQLKDDGRCAYIVPSEFLNADYGKLVKKHLLSMKSLRYVIVFDFKNKVFDEALTTSCILLFANDKHDSNVTFINVDDPLQLPVIMKEIAQYPTLGNIANSYTIPMNELNPLVKWRQYYQPQTSSHKNLVKLSNFAKVSRGIATGSNEYFCFDAKKAAQHHIDTTLLEPCLTKATQCNSSWFTKDDFDELAKTEKVWLLNASAQHNNEIAAYLSHGEELGIHTKHLTSKRKPWYSIEKRAAAPVLVSVFNRNGLRFIKNEMGIRNLTSFHCLYFKNITPVQETLLFAYLLTDIAKEIFNHQRREYGNGLAKHEPNDLNNAYVIDLTIIDTATEKLIIKTYNQYYNSIKKNKPQNKYLQQLNDIFTNLIVS